MSDPVRTYLSEFGVFSLVGPLLHRSGLDKNAFTEHDSAQIY